MSHTVVKIAINVHIYRQIIDDWNLNFLVLRFCSPTWSGEYRKSIMCTYVASIQAYPSSFRAWMHWLRVSIRIVGYPMLSVEISPLPLGSRICSCPIAKDKIGMTFLQFRRPWRLSRFSSQNRCESKSDGGDRIREHRHTWFRMLLHLQVPETSEATENDKTTSQGDRYMIESILLSFYLFRNAWTKICHVVLNHEFLRNTFHVICLIQSFAVVSTQI